MKLLTATDARLVFDTMGTVVSVSAPDGGLSEAVRSQITASFDQLDQRFSLYKPESEATAVAERRLLLRQASAEYREAYALADQWNTDTDGAFTAFRPDGKIDLSGVVKAMGIRDAAAALTGVDNWCINAGGDVLISGVEAVDKPWVVGIVNPEDRTQLISQFTCSAEFPAVCTSGVGERGEHIWRVGANDKFVQVSVAASDIVTPDILATAIIAGGPHTLELACTKWRIEALAFLANGDAYATPAFRAGR